MTEVKLRSVQHYINFDNDDFAWYGRTLRNKWHICNPDRVQDLYGFGYFAISFANLRRQLVHKNTDGLFLYSNVHLFVTTRLRTDFQI